jgi:hypothetical protein
MISNDHEQRFDLYSKGYSDIEIAKKCGVSKDTIFRWRKKNDLKSLRGKGNHLSQEERSRRIGLIEKGYTDEQCAAMIGISKQSFTHWRYNNGYRKTEPFINKITELDENEQNLYLYLAQNYSIKRDAHLLSLAKYATPQVDVSPSSTQRKYIKKIRVPGFKSVYYFDDGYYSIENKAIRMFVDINKDNFQDHPKKLVGNLPKEIYEEVCTYLNK